MYSKKTNVLFIHIPKTAGQSMTRYFLSLEGKKWKHRKRVFVTDNEDPVFIPQTAHFTLEDYRAYPYMNVANWVKKAYKFSIVRNPYDRLWSEYKWRKRRPKWDKFCTKDFLMSVKEDVQDPIRARHLLPQSDFFSPEDDVNVLRFETLQGDFARMINELGLFPRELPHANKSKGGSYIDKYDQHKIQVVKDLYGEDLERFGYDEEPAS